MFRVRVGVHTGEPALTGGSYYGVDVHRAARVTDTGHGGQIVVSRAVRDECSIADVEFMDLGTHRLRGLNEPEQVFQLVAPGLRAEFPPLRLGDKLPPGRSPGDTHAELVTRVVLAEDSVLLREGIARLLEDAGFEVVGQACDAEELMLKVRSYKPDVAIVDIRMPPTHTDEGLRAAREIRERHPDTGVLVLSRYLGPATRSSFSPRAPRVSATC